MANVAANVVQFYRGPSEQLPEAASRNVDSLYFTTDTHRIYLGAHEYADYVAGAGIDVTGNTISVESLHPGDIAEIVTPVPVTHLPNLGDLTDVNISNPVTGQSIVYDATTGEWSNGYPDGAQWSNF